MTYAQHNTIQWETTLAAVWRVHQSYLKPINNPDLVNPEQLIGIEQQKQALFSNVEHFIKKKPFNHALLWGARGMGKSSLVKALLYCYQEQGLRVIELPKSALPYLPEITDQLRELPYSFIIFCDDITFGEHDDSYIALKSTMEGSIEKPPINVLMIATSNRRHMMPEKMIDNKDGTIIHGEIHPSEAIEEKMSLADRFGLSLSFYPLSQKEYFMLIDSLFKTHSIDNKETLHTLAHRFVLKRGTRSGRTAQQFFNHYITSI